MDRKTLVKYALPVLVLALVLLLFKDKLGNITFQGIIEHLKQYILAYLILSVIAILIYLFAGKIFGKKKQQLDLLKEFVDTKPAEEILREEFIKGTNMKATYVYEGKKPTLILRDRNDLKIMQREKWDEPTSGTSYWSAEFHAKTGDRIGINYVQIRLDMGLDWLRENWQSTLLEHTPRELYKFDPRKPPVTSKSENIRLETFRAEMIDEGFSRRELRDLDRLKVRESLPVQEDMLNDEEQELINEERRTRIQEKRNRLMK